MGVAPGRDAPGQVKQSVMESASPCRKLKRKSDDFYCGGERKKKKLQQPTTTTSTTHPSLSPSPTPNSRCGRQFFDSPCEELARSLLGCALFRMEMETSAEDEKGRCCWGCIVETEAYLGGADKAAHSYGGKRTERNEAMYMAPGTAYVYSVYGIHCCFNISSRGGGAAVLIRALEPLGGMVDMRERRGRAARRDKDLCNGPAKLCQALGIDRESCDKLDVVTSPFLWVEPPPEGAGPGGVAESGRIGVEYAGEEWASKPLRYYIRDSPFVSRPTKKRS